MKRICLTFYFYQNEKNEEKKNKFVAIKLTKIVRKKMKNKNNEMKKKKFNLNRSNSGLRFIFNCAA
jgi:hypothetical protein